MANGTASMKEIFEALNEFKQSYHENNIKTAETLATIVANQKHRKESDIEMKLKLDAHDAKFTDMDKRITKNTTLLGVCGALAVPIVVAIVIGMFQFEFVNPPVNYQSPPTIQYIEVDPNDFNKNYPRGK